MVEFSDLIQFGLFVIALITLVVNIVKNKK
ncbi:hypothetical protein SAMN05216413_1523 [Ruminococcaceae bacterium KH2T8]|nr:hypothetical protein SAMN05216413_1523 [Ruminococcaceae bacterium KH2T8]